MAQEADPGQSGDSVHVLFPWQLMLRVGLICRPGEDE